ncbi:MAG: extracellular solute-binding protein [Anaerocolumna sp.]
MKIKKLTALLLVTTMLLSMILSGCSKDGASTTENKDKGEATVTKTESPEKSSGEPVEVTFWTLSTRQEAIDPIVEAFNAANDNINVTVSYYDTDGIKDACKVAATADTLPDMWFNWGGSLGGFYADNGLTYDLTDYAKEHDWAGKFSAGALNLCQLNGILAGYPTSYNVLDVYFRKDIFEKYNIAVPTTFDEFEKACATLKENGITPISTAGLNGWHVMRFVELLIEHYAGEELHDKLNTFEESWNNDAVIKALAKYQEFCDKGYFPEGFVTADPNDTLMNMASGATAMDIQGQWYDGNILSDDIDINLFATFPFPSGGSNRLSSFVEMTQFNKNLSDDKLDASVKFMDYYYSEDNAKKYAQYYNLPLPFNNAAMPEGQPNVEQMIKTSNENGTFTITDQALPTEVADVLFDAQDAIAFGEMTPEEGAANIQAAIEAYNSK